MSTIKYFLIAGETQTFINKKTKINWCPWTLPERHTKEYVLARRKLKQLKFERQEKTVTKATGPVNLKY